MFLLKMLCLVFVIGIIAGFAYVSIIDVPVRQTEIVKTIPNEGILNAE